MTITIESTIWRSCDYRFLLCDFFYGFDVNRDSLCHPKGNGDSK